MEAALTPASHAARRRVERWPYRVLLVGGLEAVAVGGLAIAVRGWVHPALAAPIVLVGVAARVLYGRRNAARSPADLADLRAAGPALTPHARARAFLLVTPSLDPPPHWARRREIEELRTYLNGLPGGMRLRSNLALRDPDAPGVPRAFAIRALALYPLLATAPVALASAIDGTPKPLREITGMLTLLGPPALTWFDRVARDFAPGRRAFWALLSASCLPLLVLAAAVLAAIVG